MAVSINARVCPVVDAQQGLELLRRGSTADFAFTRDKLTLDVHPPRTNGDAIEVDMALAPSPCATGVE